MKACKICDKEINFDVDYGAQCHTIHKMMHCTCHSKKIREKAKRDFDRS